jgi:3'-5' exonuclease
LETQNYAVLKDILFLDIETVPIKMNFLELSEIEKELWQLKTKYIQEKEGKTPAEIYEKAGIYAEFGKIICISVASFWDGEEQELSLKVKSYYGKEEREILIDFAQLLNKNRFKKQLRLCGHNAKEFDLPYICRRMIINGIKLPDAIALQGKKPWEINHLDTMEMWKFGDYKHYTSLQLLANILGIETPKDDISGADVSRTFWEENNLERIKTYCEKDTITVAQVYLKMMGLKIVQKQNIEHVN